MLRPECFHGFDFDKHLPFDQQINIEISDRFAAELYFDRLLRLNENSFACQGLKQSFFVINGLQKSASQFIDYLECTSNYRVCQFLIQPISIRHFHVNIHPVYPVHPC